MHPRKLLKLLLFLLKTHKNGVNGRPPVNTVARIIGQLQILQNALSLSPIELVVEFNRAFAGAFS